MPKDIDPHGTVKQNNRWAVKRYGKAKTQTGEAGQKKVLEKAMEIAKKRNAEAAKKGKNKKLKGNNNQ